MSRSFKKHGYSGICSSYGDKFCRTKYHRADRRKVRSILKSSPDSEKIITKGIDYSLPYADKWSWASDGGSFWQGDLLILRKNFDAELFASKSNIWNNYINYTKRKHNEAPAKLTIRFKKFIGSEKIRVFCFEHEVRKYDYKLIHVPYNKEHKFDKNLIPEGYEFDTAFKSKNFGWHGTSKWSCIFFDMIPTTLQNSDELVKWLRENEEKMIRSIYKMRYGK